MVFWINENLPIYLPFLVALPAQIVFLLLPLNLRNWEDDLINVVTYIAIQMTSALLIFVAIPLLLGIFALGTSRASILLFIVLIASAVRATKLIPLEKTHAVVLPSQQQFSPSFSDFYSSDRMFLLAHASEADNTSDGKSGYQTIQQRLTRIKSRSRNQR